MPHRRNPRFVQPYQDHHDRVIAFGLWVFSPIQVRITAACLLTIANCTLQLYYNSALQLYCNSALAIMYGNQQHQQRLLCESETFTHI